MALAAAVMLGAAGQAQAHDATCTAQQWPADLIDAGKAIAGLQLDIRYATPNNFTGKTLYPAAVCWLRQEAAGRLARVQERLKQQALGLIVHDCYRPLAVQYELWKVKPVPGYVADPKVGSVHNRAAAVDVSLYDRQSGQPLEMPSAYDDLSPKAHHDYPGGTEAARRHRQILKAAMMAEGFHPNRMEWWHYEAPRAKKFPLLDVPLTGACPP